MLKPNLTRRLLYTEGSKENEGKPEPFLVPFVSFCARSEDRG